MDYECEKMRSHSANVCRLSIADSKRTFVSRRMMATTMVALIIPIMWPAWERAHAQESIDNPREYAVKAVFLYSFGRYVTWPAESFEKTKGMFVISVLGPNPFGDALDRIAKKRQAQGRPIKVHYWSSSQELEPCQVLFVVGAPAAEDVSKVVRNTAGMHVLLVGESPEFAARGGMINFFVEEDAVRFEINAEAAKHEKLGIKAQLLSLGRAVPTTR